VVNLTAALGTPKGCVRIASERDSIPAKSSTLGTRRDSIPAYLERIASLRGWVGPTEAFLHEFSKQGQYVIRNKNPTYLSSWLSFLSENLQSVWYISLLGLFSVNSQPIE
jgi:hypothetical protein